MYGMILGMHLNYMNTSFLICKRKAIPHIYHRFLRDITHDKSLSIRLLALISDLINLASFEQFSHF